MLQNTYLLSLKIIKTNVNDILSKNYISNFFWIYDIRGRPQRTSAQNHEKLTPSPLVRTGSTPFPPCPCGHTINFEKFDIFCTKKCGRSHSKNPLSPWPQNVRTGQPTWLRSGRPLWTAPNNSLYHPGRLLFGALVFFTGFLIIVFTPVSFAVQRSISKDYSSNKCGIFIFRTFLKI